MRISKCARQLQLQQVTLLELRSLRLRLLAHVNWCHAAMSKVPQGDSAIRAGESACGKAQAQEAAYATYVLNGTDKLRRKSAHRDYEQFVIQTHRDIIEADEAHNADLVFAGFSKAWPSGAQT